MLIWINGPFGGGKTSAARELVASRDDLRLFDPEWIGYMLLANLADVPHADFQDLAPWRALVPIVAAEIAALTGQTLVVVQTVLVESYWQELRSGLEAVGLPPTMVLLDCGEDELRRRIVSDSEEAGAMPWRLDHIAPFIDSKPWLTRESAIVIDTTRLTSGDVAGIAITDSLR